MADTKTEPNGSTEYVWKGRTGPFEIALSPAVFTPTHTSLELAKALEVTASDLVLDVGCGSGVLSFVAARLGARHVVGTDVSPDAVALAGRNASALGLADITEFRVGSLFEPVRDLRADVVIGDVSGIPDAIAALTGWYPGGPTGAELPVAMLSGLGECLAPGGRLYLPTGTIQDEERILDAAREVFEGGVEEAGSREFPLPGSVAESDAVSDLLKRGVVKLRQRGSFLWWRLTVWVCKR